MEIKVRTSRIEEIKTLYSEAKTLSDELIQTGEDNSFTALLLTNATISLKNAYEEAKVESGYK